MTLGKRLRLLREAKDLDRPALAAAAGVSRTTLFNLETGEVEEARGATLERIARALGVDRAALEDDRECIRELARLLHVQQGMVGVAQRPRGTLTLFQEEGDFGLVIELKHDEATQVHELRRDVESLYRKWPALLATEIRSTPLPQPWDEDEGDGDAPAPAVTDNPHSRRKK